MIEMTVVGQTKYVRNGFALFFVFWFLVLVFDFLPWWHCTSILLSPQVEKACHLLNTFRATSSFAAMSFWDKVQAGAKKVGEKAGVAAQKTKLRADM